MSRIVRKLSALLMIPSTLALISGTVAACGSSQATSAASSRSTPASPQQTPTDSSFAVDCARAKCIALTYDDGPSPLTSALISTLQKEHATATFFMLGNAVQTFPDTARQVHEAGFEIGSHTTTHANLTQLSETELHQEITTTSQRIKTITGSDPVIVRPPYGATNNRVNSTFGQQGLAVVNWDTSPEDWNNHTASAVVNLTLDRARPGYIILMHDTHQWTVDAAPALIKGLRDQGYTLVTVSKLLGKLQPGVLYPRR